MPRRILSAGTLNQFGAGGIQFTGSQYMEGPGSGYPRISGSGTSGTLSMWLRFDANDGATMALFNGSNFIGDNMQWTRDSSNKLSFYWFTSSGTWHFKTSNSYVAGPNWYHVMAAWQKSGNIQQIYVDGVSDCVSVSTAGSGNLKVSSAFVASGPSQLFVGAWSQVWLDDVYNDISDSAFRDKFVQDHHPIDLGSSGANGQTGTLPTGTSPKIFLSGYASSAGINSGRSGGTSLLDPFTRVGDFTVSGTPVNTESPS